MTSITTFYFKKYIVLALFILFVLKMNGQDVDTTGEERFTIHAQSTVITQYKPAFYAKYSGINSLQPQEDIERSITSTMFMGARLWKGASAYFNPEIASGSGLSGSYGVGASSNGETYRIANPTPTFELARLFFQQIYTFNKGAEYQESDINTLGGKKPTNYFSFLIGKICVSDYFDLNKYSHDPRTQFISWGLMSNAAWDYPANTRGYTPSVILTYVTPKNELRFGFSLVSKVANGMIMNWDISKTGAYSLEYTRNYTLFSENGALRVLSFFNLAKMGNYNQSIEMNPVDPSIFSTERYGHTKYGFGVNAEQAITEDMGVFFKASWNDGNNETWMFTEIDRSVSFGISCNGDRWNRKKDVVGLASVTSGISLPHRTYLHDGGLGFELGDGNLNYGLEHLDELYYSMELVKHLFVSGTYQFLLNPGYNKDRGPVNIFSLRVHVFI
jgi:high affinity Mn2+ porin